MDASEPMIPAACATTLCAISKTPITIFHVFGLFSMVIALLGVAVLITYSPQNGVILLVMAFLISPMGLPLAAIWLLGKVQSLKFAIQDWVYE